MGKVNTEAAISQEISTLEEQMRYANELREKIKDATDKLTDGFFGLINAGDEFDKINKENIEAIRLYKFTMSTEAKAIEDAAKSISSSVSRDRLEQLGEFVGLCERLQTLRNAGFFSSVKIDA